MDFKTSNVQYMETTCLIDFKLAGVNKQANWSLYTDF